MDRERRDTRDFQERRRTVKASDINPDDIPLNDVEMLNLQRALLALGFDIGKPDGKAGRRTGAAISRFLNDRGLDPYQVPIRVALRLILANTASKPPAVQSAEKTTTRGSSVPARGLPTNDGAILFATQTNHALRTRISGGDADGYDRDIDLFGRLLILSGAPQLLDEPGKTSFFLPLVKLDELGPYVDPNALKLTARYGNGHLDEWRGDNQFAKEDSRKSFLAAYRARLLAQAPTMPLRIDIVRSVRFGKYDGSSLALDVDSQSVFPHYSQIGLSAVEPFERLTKWVLDEADARRIVETQARVLANDQYNGPVIVTRAEVTAIRPTENGILLDIAAIDTTAFATAAMDRPLGQLPLPPNAVVKPEATAQLDAASDAQSPLDPVFVRMLAAKEEPQLAATDEFHLETFRMRRAAEKRYRSLARQAVVDWPKLIPASLVASNEAPGASDVAKLTRWFTSARDNIGSQAQLHGFCWFGSDGKGQCDLPPDAKLSDGTLALKSLVSAAVRSWDYAWHGLPEGSSEAVTQAYPDAAGSVPFGAGKELPGVLVLRPHPAWFSSPSPAVKLSNAALNVRVVGQKFVSAPNGKRLIAVEISPVSIQYQSGGKWQTFDIAPVGEKVAGPEGTLDVLGVRIGMPLDVAKEEMAKHFEGRGSGILEQKKSGSDPVFGQRDPIFGEMLTFKNFPSKSIPETVGAEAVRLFFDSSHPEKAILAVDRSVKFAVGVNSNEASRSSGQPVFDTILQKYGAPDRKSDLANPTMASLWAVEPTTKARVKSGDESCDLNIWVSTTFYSDSPSHSGLIKNNCGELLSIWFRNGVASQVLVDTSAVLKLRQRYASEIQAKEAAEKAAQPAVKF